MQWGTTVLVILEGVSLRIEIKYLALYLSYFKHLFTEVTDHASVVHICICDSLLLYELTVQVAKQQQQQQFTKRLNWMTHIG